MSPDSPQQHHNDEIDSIRNQRNAEQPYVASPGRCSDMHNTSSTSQSFTVGEHAAKDKHAARKTSPCCKAESSMDEGQPVGFCPSNMDQDDEVTDRRKGAKAAKSRFQGRFSGRLKSKEDEKKLAEECRLLGPYLGGVGQRGNRSHQTLAQIVRGIASGEVREYCEQREKRVKALKAKAAAVDESGHLELKAKVKELQSENTLLKAELELKALRLLELEKERQQKHVSPLQDDRQSHKDRNSPAPAMPHMPLAHAVDRMVSAEQILRGLGSLNQQQLSTLLGGDRPVAEQVLRGFAAVSQGQGHQGYTQPYEVLRQSAAAGNGQQQLEIIRFVPQYAAGGGVPQQLLTQELLNFPGALGPVQGLNLASLQGLAGNGYAVQVPISYVQVQQQNAENPWPPAN